MVVACVNTFAFDFAVRLKTPGIHVNVTSCNQAPLMLPHRSASLVARILADIWIVSRVLELTYTAWDLEPFARDCGYTGRPSPLGRGASLSTPRGTCRRLLPPLRH